MAELYILHFDKPVMGKAQHYVGYTTLGVEERIKVHRSGNGSKLVRYAIQKGIDFKVVFTQCFPTRWEARAAELKLKKERNLKAYCSICTPEKKLC